MKINHTVRIPILISLSLTIATAQTPTSRIVSAANTFLSALDQKQRQSVLFAFDDEQQRKRWSNVPTGFVPRGGIDLKDMTPAQRTAAMALVASALSQRGLEKVRQIMDAHGGLKSTEGNGPPPGRADGRGDGRGGGRGGNGPPGGRGGGGQ